jgi:hypothetical protein
MHRMSRASVIATMAGGFLSVLSSGCGNTAAAPPITVSLSPSAATVEVGTTAQFEATVTNDPANAGVNWSVSCSAPPCGSVSPTHTSSGASTTFTPPASQAGQLMVSLTAASASDPTKSQPATITVAAVTITLSSTSVTLVLGAQAPFSATVANDGANAGVNWTVSCPQAACGSITLSQTRSGGSTTYTAPTAPPAGNLFVTLTAASVTDSAVMASATITVPGIVVSVSPPMASVESGGTQQFSVSVSGDPNNAGVTWQLDVLFTYKLCDNLNKCPPQTINPPCDSSCGSVSPTSSASGGVVTYSAAATPPIPPIPPGSFLLGYNLTLFALSKTNSSAYSGGRITVLPISVSVSPTYGFVALGRTTKLTPTVTNDATNSGVNWKLTQNGVACSPGCGTISPTATASGTAATYTAPATAPNSPVVAVTATSAEDPGASATATLTLTTSSGAAACSTGFGSESLLMGQYAFLLQGVSFSNLVDALLDTTLAGSITADGTGKITSGEEDISSGAAFIPSMSNNPDHTSINPAGSVYAVGPDRRGCLILTGADGTILSLRFALSSNTNSNNVATGGRVIGFDSATGEGDHLTGKIRLQDPTSFAAAQFKGNYVMQATGSDLLDGRFALAGTFTADGASAITSGTFDVNDAGTFTSDLSLSSPAGNFACCSSNGRGTLTLEINLPASDPAYSVSSITWSFYMVDSSDAFLVTKYSTYGSGEAIGIPSGTTFSQSSLSGASALRETARSSFSPIVDIATADADGKGTITVNDNINAAGSFTSSSTAFDYVVSANGRAALSGGITPPVMYLFGQNQGFLLGTDANVTVGILEPQTGGPFSNASFAGSYVLGTENPSSSSVTTQSGVLTADGSGNVTGTSDQASSAGLNADQGFNFSYSISTNGIGNVGSGTTAIMISPNKLAFINNTDPNPAITVIEK